MGHAGQPPRFICQGSAVAELLLARWGYWEPSQEKQLILFQNRDLPINKCLVADAFFSLLALLSSFSCPSFLSPWLESWLSPKRAKGWLEQRLDAKAAQDQLLC